MQLTKNSKTFNAQVARSATTEEACILALRASEKIGQSVILPSTAQNKTGWDAEVYLISDARPVRIDVKTYDVPMNVIREKGYFDQYKEQLYALELANKQEGRSCGFAKTGADYVAFQTMVFNALLLGADDNWRQDNDHYFDQAEKNARWYTDAYGHDPSVVSLVERPFLTWLCAEEAYKEQVDDFPMHVKCNRAVDGESPGRMLFVSLSNLRAMERLWIKAGRPTKRNPGGPSLKEITDAM